MRNKSTRREAKSTLLIPKALRPQEWTRHRYRLRHLVTRWQGMVRWCLKIPICHRLWVVLLATWVLVANEISWNSKFSMPETTVFQFRISQTPTIRCLTVLCKIITRCSPGIMATCLHRFTGSLFNSKHSKTELPTTITINIIWLQILQLITILLLIMVLIIIINIVQIWTLPVKKDSPATIK